MATNTARKNTNTNLQEDLSRWTDEGGAPVDTETGSTSRPVADSRPLPSSNLGLGEEGEVQVSQEREELTTFRLFSRTFLPIAIAMISALIALMSKGSVSVIFSIVAALGFAWFALRFAWVDKGPHSRLF